ncbi:MAG: hypothetical protein ABH845_03855 [Candidatus Omnitrophota bacterium]
MSLINDALRKVEHEKGTPESNVKAQALEYPPSPTERKKQRRTSILFVSLGILFAIGMMGLSLGMLFMVKSQPVPRTFEAPLQKTTPVATKEEVNAAPESPSPVLRPPETSKTPAAASPIPFLSPLLQKPTETLYVLNGIVQGEGEELAIINNQITRLGEVVDGAVLVEIRKDYVVLEAEEKRLQLKIK